MRKFAVLISTGFLTGLLFVACAQKQTEATVSKEVANQPQVSSSAAVGQQTKDLIESGNFTLEQKSKLRDLRTSAHAQISQLREESLKLQALLVQKVLKSEYSPKEVKVIEKRMRDVEQKRLSVMFDSVSKANQILGREASDLDRQIIMQDMMFAHGEKNAY